MLGLIALVAIVPIGAAVASAVKGSAAAASATKGAASASANPATGSSGASAGQGHNSHKPVANDEESISGIDNFTNYSRNQLSKQNRYNGCAYQ